MIAEKGGLSNALQALYSHVSPAQARFSGPVRGLRTDVRGDHGRLPAQPGVAPVGERSEEAFAKRMLQQADEKLAKIFRGHHDVPSFPAVVQKLLKLTGSDANSRQYAEIIAADQGLAAKVLRLVNSAFYSLREPICSLGQASGLLGTKTLKSLALSISSMNLFNRSCPGFDPKAFWKHSISVGLAAQRLGTVFLPRLEQELYVAGLLHDMGVALLVQYLTEEYGLVIRLVQSSGRPLEDAEMEVLGITHPEVGHMLASRWMLPRLVCDGIRHHHAEGELQERTVASREAVDIVRFADQWSCAAGYNYLSSDSAPADSRSVDSRPADSGSVDSMAVVSKPEAPSLPFGPDAAGGIPGDWKRAEAALASLPADLVAREQFLFSEPTKSFRTPARQG